MSRVYEEMIDFIASGTTPAGLTAFRSSPAVRQRVAELIEQERAGGLSPDETAELHHCLELEHLMRLARARARRHLLPQVPVVATL